MGSDLEKLSSGGAWEVSTGSCLYDWSYSEWNYTSCGFQPLAQPPSIECCKESKLHATCHPWTEATCRSLGLDGEKCAFGKDPTGNAQQSCQFFGRGDFDQYCGRKDIAFC